MIVVCRPRLRDGTQLVPVVGVVGLSLVSVFPGRSELFKKLQSISNITELVKYLNWNCNISVPPLLRIKGSEAVGNNSNFFYTVSEINIHVGTERKVTYLHIHHS